jgi:hypothetical protein
MTKHSHFSTAISIAVLAVLSACTTGQPAVIEKLDELTAATVTYCRTPLIMSPDTPHVRESRRDYVQIGVIEVNRMGTLEYYLWLGITEVDQVATANTHPEGFSSIVLAVDETSIELDVNGWSPSVIGTSASVYQKIFPDSADAYYQVTLKQIQLLTDSDRLTLRTTGSAAKEFVSWYSQTTFESDLSEFLREVME